MTKPSTISLTDDLALPWSTVELWQAANDAVAHAMSLHRQGCKTLHAIAQQIQSRIELMDGLMESLCETVCASCADNCCQRATVWYDFRDLLYLHAASVAPPPGQLITAPGQTCRYLTARGCDLPRTRRPFVCTWFVCASQMQAMVPWPPSQKIFLLNSLQALKHGRKRIERLFIQLVVES